MIRIYSYRQVIISCLIVPLLSMILDVTAIARTTQQEEPRVSSVDWKVVGDIILITYDLVGSTEESYEISVVLLREKDPSFKAIPKSLAGDVEKGNFVGKGREIRWEYKKDFPEGLQGEDFYFEVSVQTISGGSSLLYIVIGGAVAAGGAVALLGGKKSESTPGPPGTELPSPPPRP
ncbi:MAG TPA: hypothetical protein VFF29_01100 [Bacteroidota bacterium]|nr:hypothetical protein [Bacteroidota bacterium]